MTSKPEPGSFWQHHSGNLYRVLFIANDVENPRPDYPVTVIYETVHNGKKWAGRLDDWHRRMTLQSQLGLDKPVFAKDVK